MNQTVTKHAGGRPTKCTPEITKKLVEYFYKPATKTLMETYYYKDGTSKDKQIEVANDLSFFNEFEHKHDLSVGRCAKWARAKNEDGTYKNPEFRLAYKNAKKLQESMMVKCALKGLYSGAFTIFAMKNMHKWKDKSEVETTHKGLNPILDAIDKRNKGQSV